MGEGSNAFDEDQHSKRERRPCLTIHGLEDQQPPERINTTPAAETAGISKARGHGCASIKITGRSIGCVNEAALKLCLCDSLRAWE